MAINILLPNISGKTDAEQLNQLKSYLYSMAEQLNWAFNTISMEKTSEIVLQDAVGKALKENQAYTNFNAIKDFVIKNADIVDAYYEEIENLIDLSGKYVSSASFPGGVGTYIENTSNSISANSQSITQNIKKTEDLEINLGEVEKLARKQDGYIKSGIVGSTLAPENAPDAIGIELGEFNSVGDSESRRYARFTTYGLELFGDNKNKPVAYISQNKLYITNAEFKGDIKLGGYSIATQNGLAFKWVGV